MSVRVALLAVIAGLASLLASALPDSWRAELRTELRTNQFTQHMQKFSLAYTGAEYDARLQVFSQNVAKIELHNQDPTRNFKVGVNQFTHLSYDEYLAYVDMGRPKEPLSAAERELSDRMPVHRASADHEERKRKLVDTPTVDWRKIKNSDGIPIGVTPVKNQGQCGSCWTFAAAGAMESAYMLMSGKDAARSLGDNTRHAMTPQNGGVSFFYGFSEQNFVNCVGGCGDPGCKGCNGGFAVNAYYYAYMMGGVPTEKDYPYVNVLNDNVHTCSDATNTVHADTVLDPTNPWVNVEPWSISALEAAVRQQPIAIAISASCPEFNNYESGILDSTSSCRITTDHAVLLVGFGSDSEIANGMDYWIVKNSWDTTWGMEGYIYIEKSPINVAGVTTNPTYPNIKGNIYTVPAAPALSDVGTENIYEVATGSSISSGIESITLRSAPSATALTQVGQMQFRTTDLHIEVPEAATATEPSPAIVYSNVPLYHVPYVFSKENGFLIGDESISCYSGAVIVNGADFATNKSNWTIVVISLVGSIPRHNPGLATVYIADLGSYAPLDLMKFAPTLVSRDGPPDINANTIAALSYGFNTSAERLNNKFGHNVYPRGTHFSLKNIKVAILPLSVVPTAAPTIAPVAVNNVIGTFVTKYFWSPSISNTDADVIAACASGVPGTEGCTPCTAGANGVIEVKRTTNTCGTCQWDADSSSYFAVFAGPVPVTAGAKDVPVTLKGFSDENCTNDIGSDQITVKINQCAPATDTNNPNWWKYTTYVASPNPPAAPVGVPGTIRYVTQDGCTSQDPSKIASSTTYVPSNCIPVGEASSFDYISTACSNFGIQTYHYADSACTQHISAEFESHIATSRCTFGVDTKTYVSTFGCPEPRLPAFSGTIAGTLTTSIMQTSGADATCTATRAVAEYMQPYGRCENKYDGTFSKTTVNSNVATTKQYSDPLCTTQTANEPDTMPLGCETTFWNLKASVTATPSSNGLPAMFSLDARNNDVARAYIFPTQEDCMDMNLSEVMYAMDIKIGTCLTGMFSGAGGVDFKSMKVSCANVAVAGLGPSSATIETFEDTNCVTSMTSSVVSGMFATQPIVGGCSPIGLGQPASNSGPVAAISCPLTQRASSDVQIPVCERGYFLTSSWGQSGPVYTCQKCGKGTYNPYVGFEWCFGCPTNSYEVGATSCAQGTNVAYSTGSIAGTESLTFSSAQTNTCSDKQFEIARTYGMCTFVATVDVRYNFGGNPSGYDYYFLKEAVDGTSITGTYYSDAQCTRVQTKTALQAYTIPLPPTECFNINTVAPGTPNVPSLFFGQSIVSGTSIAATSVPGSSFSLSIFGTHDACIAAPQDMAKASFRVNIATGVCVKIPDLLVQMMAEAGTEVPAEFANKRSAIMSCSGEALGMEMFSDSDCQAGGENTDLSAFFALVGGNSCMDLEHAAKIINLAAANAFNESGGADDDNGGDDDSKSRRRLPIIPGDPTSGPTSISTAGGGSSTSTFTLSFPPPRGYMSYKCSSAVRCEAGQYNRAGTCTACEAGKYQNQAGQMSCINCPGAGVGQSTCLSCIDGQKPNHSTGQCEPCPANTYSNNNTNMVCTKCPDMNGKKTFAPAQSATCTVCPAGKSSANGVSCEICAANTFSSSTGATSCTPCAAGSFAPAQSAICTVCPAGKSSANGVSCEDCTFNTFSSSTGATSCTPCAAGSTTTSIGAITCTGCPPGQFFDVEVNGCSFCAVNTFSASADSTSCAPCAPGTKSNRGSSTCVTPRTCAAGSELSSSNECKTCPIMSYSDASTSFVCTPCAQGWRAVSTGATTCTCSVVPAVAPGNACTPPADTNTCLPGTQLVSGKCAPCPQGTYSGFSATTCTACPANKSTPSTGSVQADCSSTGFCEAGNYWNSVNLVCQACPPNTYRTSAGATSIADCLLCPDSKISPRGSIGESSCKAIPQTGIECGEGYFLTGSTSSGTCTPCPPNTFSSTTGATSRITCRACAQGKVSSIGSAACATATVVTVCKPGNYVSSGKCTPCQVGFYSDRTNADICAKCPSGQSSPPMATSCITLPTNECPPGTYRDGAVGGITTCTLCSQGTWSAAVNAASASACLSCPLYMGSPAGSSSKNQCGTGGAVSCPLGTSAAGGTGRCSPCSPGTYGVVAILSGISTPACTKCETGKSSNTGAIDRAACFVVTANMTPSPTMAPIPAEDSFKMDMSMFIVADTTAAKFNSNPANINAFKSAMQTSLFDPTNPSNEYIISDVKAADGTGRRRALTSTTGVSVKCTVSVENAKNVDPDTVNAQLAIEVNTGEFSSNLNAIASGTPGADASLKTSIAQDFSASLSSAPSDVPAPEQKSKNGAKSPTLGIIGGVCGVVFFAGAFFHFRNKRLQKEAADAQADSATNEKNFGDGLEMQQNPIQDSAAMQNRLHQDV